MKIVSVSEISLHFTRHAQISNEGEDVRVFRAGKPYVRIVRDEETLPSEVPVVDFGSRAKKDFVKNPAKTDIVRQIVRNRRSR
jgi:hypothetical protein